MLGEENMPYCWAAKSKRKVAGALRANQRTSKKSEELDDLPAIWRWSKRYPYSLSLD